MQDINPGAATSFPVNFTAVGGLVFFSASISSSGNELWEMPYFALGGVPISSAVLMVQELKWISLKEAQVCLNDLSPPICRRRWLCC
jgi:hypothetical protein